jgi:hypothetical protein
MGKNCRFFDSRMQGKPVSEDKNAEKQQAERKNGWHKTC